MRVLIIEDHIAISGALLEHLRTNCAGVTATVTADAQTAEMALDTGPFDAIVCDRKIPTQAGSLDESEEIGDALIGRIAQQYPGTPILVLTSYASLDLALRYMRNPRTGDVFGNGEEHWLLNLFEKSDLSRCLAELSKMAEECALLDDIEVIPAERDHDVRRTERRVMQLFARQMGGSVALVQPISGGLSDVKTWRVRVEEGHGAIRSLMFAKIGRLSLLDDEVNRYNQFVPGLLRSGIFAPLGRRIDVGVGDVGGVFYNMAVDFDESLFELVMRDPTMAAALVAPLAVRMEGWQSASRRAKVTVGEIRRAMLKDEPAREFGTTIFGERRWGSLESRSVAATLCPQHCDLHGHNVLTAADERLLVIDYADIKSASSCMDFVVLELSLLFHTKNVLGNGGWPTVEQAVEWPDLDAFCVGAPWEQFIRSCRKAALAQAVGARQLLASAYAYALRQFKYADTNKELAAAIVRGCAAAIESE